MQKSKRLQKTEAIQKELEPDLYTVTKNICPFTKKR